MGRNRAEQELLGREEYKAIPPGYITVGEIARKMGVTVRTLQYYDREDILPASSESEGGRRLYTHKDMVKLHQIQSMKRMGFSLADIKTRLPAINTPEEVSAVLIEQAEGIREKIKSLQGALESVEKLNAEVTHMKTVDWAKYADIALAIQSKADAYWMMKYLGDNFFRHVRHRFGEKNQHQMLDKHNRLMKEAAALQQSGHRPESEPVQALAKDWWDYIMEFSGGDTNLITELVSVSSNLNDGEWKDRFSFDKEFIGKAILAYLKTIGYNLLEEETYHD